MIDLTKFGGQYIPLIRNGKKPSTKFKGLTFDNNYLNQHYHAGGNFGLLAQPNFIFVDIDTSHGSDGMANFIAWLVENNLDPQEIIDNTLSAETATGGFHLVFLQDAKNRFKQDIGFLDGVDIKASPNNYIVVSPSVIDGKPYKWIREVEPQPIPLALVEAMHKKAEEKKRSERIELAEGTSAIIDGLRYSRRFNRKPQLDVFYTIENGWGESGTRNRNIFKWAQAMRLITDDQETAMRYAEQANDNSEEPVDIEEVDRTVDSAYNFNRGLEEFKYNDFRFIKLLPNLGDEVSKYVVLPSVYDRVKSSYPEDYDEKDLYLFGVSSQYQKGAQTVRAYVMAHSDTSVSTQSSDDSGLPF